MKPPIRHFNFCPRCGRPRARLGRAGLFHCTGCGFFYHFNPAIAAGGFLFDSAGRVLFVRRANDPARGKLALPGGFVDFGETAEAALRREIREEVGLRVGPLTYLCSQINEYPFREVRYSVLDLFFTAPVASLDGLRPLDGVAGLCWVRPGKVGLTEIAFPSVRRALEFLRARGKPGHKRRNAARTGG